MAILPAKGGVWVLFLVLLLLLLSIYFLHQFIVDIGRSKQGVCFAYMCVCVCMLLLIISAQRILYFFRDFSFFIFRKGVRGKGP